MRRALRRWKSSAFPPRGASRQWQRNWRRTAPCSLPRGAAALAGYAGYRAVCGEGYLGNVAVVPALRRRGVGRTLMEALILQAERQNLAFLTLEVRRSNHAAIALYSGLGFRQAGVRPGYYTAPKEDALLLTLYFNGEEGNG